MSRFAQLGTTVTALGPCQCPGTPHEKDEAVQYEILGWDDVADIAIASSEGAARRIMVARSIASWNLQEYAPTNNGHKPELEDVPVTEATVRLIDKAAADALWEPAYRAFVKARERLPNESSAESPRSSPETDTSTLTTLATAKPSS